MNKKTYDRIASEIHSDISPVGIDAKKTHIMILALLEEMKEEIRELRKEVETLKEITSS